MSGFHSLCSGEPSSVLLDGMDACEELVADVELCCSGCGLAYVVRPGEIAGDGDPACRECGCPLYVVVDEGLGVVGCGEQLGHDADLPRMMEAWLECLACGEDCRFHRALGVGWDLAVAFMVQHVERERAGELGGGDEVDAEMAEGRR